MLSAIRHWGAFYTAGGSYNPFRFQRTVYHPHGALDTGRGCVFAKSDYESLRGTLALELAIHAAFGSRLVIVGMSLDDVYLREQIVKYRQYLGHILWFTSSLPPATASWAQASEVDFVEIEDWELFWKGVQSTGPFLNKRQVDKAWYIVTELAAGNDDVQR